MWLMVMRPRVTGATSPLGAVEISAKLPGSNSFLGDAPASAYSLPVQWQDAMKPLLGYVRKEGANVFSMRQVVQRLPHYDHYHFREDREPRASFSAFVFPLSEPSIDRFVNP